MRLQFDANQEYQFEGDNYELRMINVEEFFYTAGLSAAPFDYAQG